MPRRLLLSLRILAIVLGAASAAAGIAAQSMNEDGIAYLDQGDAWMRGDWGEAVNGTWSPLYPVLLGAAMRVVRPAMAWEFPLVHVINFGLYLVALFAFEWFWRETTKRYEAPATESCPPTDRLPPWAVLTIGYLLFIWTSTSLIRVFAVTPDMLVAIAIFVTGGLLMRMDGGDHGWRTMASLGATLGVGYLAKAAMFPLGIVSMGIVAILLMRSHRSPRLVWPAAAAFILVTAPFVIALSSKYGHVTFSEVGRVTYLKHVLGTPFPHYQPGTPGVTGLPDHPIGRSTTTPVVYAFAGPVGGTYPLTYDPAWWHSGLTPQVTLAAQFRAVAVNAQRYFDLFFRTQGLVVGIAVLVGVVLWRGYQRPFSAGGWPLVLVALAALGMYSLVYVEGRYLAPFLVLLWGGLLLRVRLTPNPGNAPWLRACGWGVTLAILVNIGAFQLDGLNALIGIAPVAKAGPVSRTAAPSHRPLEVAEGLRAAGIRPGDRIGVIGESIGASWARLARVRIVADVTPDDLATFWAGAAERRAAVEHAFARASARAIIATPPANGVVPDGWRPVGATSYLIRFVDD